MSGAHPKDMTPDQFFGPSTVQHQLEQIAANAWRIPAGVIEQTCRDALDAIRNPKETQ